MICTYIPHRMAWAYVALGWSVRTIGHHSKYALLAVFQMPPIEILRMEKKMADDKPRATLSGRPPETEGPPAPAPIDPETGMHKDYWVLPEEERAKGFVRPVRRSYVHKTCGAVTTMAQALAETFARDPAYYGATFCAHCRTHFPVAEFTWDGTDEVVGS